MKRLQGAWRQVGWEKDGIENPSDEKGWDPQVTFIGDAFIVRIADGTIPIKGRYKLDPTQEPKAIDITDTFGADAGKTFLGIYTLEGDRLVFCLADEGQDRPTEFKTRAGQVLRVNRRDVQPRRR